MPTHAENLANLAAAFLGDASNQSVTANGYQKLPGGLIIQWGTSNMGGSANNVIIDLPIPFPNAVFIALAVDKVAGTVASDKIGYDAAASSLTQLKFWGETAGSFGNICWLAIGN